MAETNEQSISLNLVAEIVTAYVSNNDLPTNQLPMLIGTVHHTLLNVDEKSPEIVEPAVPVRNSVQPDYIVCLEDGKKFKTLKRHLKTAFNLSPKEYRRKWGLPNDYPMVAPNYAVLRSELAKKIGLSKGARGRRGRKKVAAKPVFRARVL
jgi:predicted transcriptional regulator